MYRRLHKQNVGSDDGSYLVSPFKRQGGLPERKRGERGERTFRRLYDLPVRRVAPAVIISGLMQRSRRHLDAAQ